MGDWSGFMDKIHEVVPMDQQPELLQKLSEGNFTLRIMYEQFQNLLKMGPISQVLFTPDILYCNFVIRSSYILEEIVSGLTFWDFWGRFVGSSVTLFIVVRVVPLVLIFTLPSVMILT